MGALPKRKVSKSRRDRRRAHDHATIFHLVKCSNPDCGQMRRAHHMCPFCRTYKGRQVLPAFEE